MEYINKLEEDVNDFILERLNDNYDKLIKDTEYIKRKEEYNYLLDKVRHNVEINLFDEYREKCNHLQYLELQEAYKMGFLDSMIILSEKNKD